MSTLITPHDGPTSTPVASDTAPSAPAGRAWPLAGIAAGVLTAVASNMGNGWIRDPAVYADGPEAVVAALPDALPTQLAAFLGYVGVALLVVFAAGLIRFVQDRAPDRRELAGSLTLFLGAAVATMSAGFMMKSVLASGMPGGTDIDYYTVVDTAVSYTLANQLQFAGFLPLMGAAGIVAVLALRHGVLQRWIGVVSVLVPCAVMAVTAAFNLPWSAGLLGPVWLLLVSVAALRRARRAV